MAKPFRFVQQIETFVDVSCSTTQQAASLEAVASALKDDSLSIEQLVKEMELYLTTTDNVVRARGILLLAEALKHLEAKSLGDAVIHSLIAFFAERLADWRALRGALIGCLALLRRKRTTGVVTATDAEAVGSSFLENLQVQSLAQHDRKLCFELLECLLESYPEALKSRGDMLVYGICEAVDGEKDPGCLMTAFHIIELLAKLFPDESSPVASNASDLFDVIGCYFPLHFTHAKEEDAVVKRDVLSRALMLAFSSTPLFEPFAIPLLLEKLSSSLATAKVDSLKYLRDCATKYGANRMAKHYRGLWSALKDAIYPSAETQLIFTPETLSGPGIQEDEIQKEALDLVQRLVMQDISFLSFIVDDVDIGTVFGTISRYYGFKEMPEESKRKVLVISQILSASVKASVPSCSRIFELFFFRLLSTLGIVVKNSEGDYILNAEDSTISCRFHQGGLYLCIRLLEASKDHILNTEECSVPMSDERETWCSMVERFSLPLTHVFISAGASINENNGDADVYLGVKGLVTLGMFRGGFSVISKSVFEKILIALTSIITAECAKTLPWKLALKALVSIGLFVESYHEAEKPLSYMKMVVDKFAPLAFSDEYGSLYSLKLEATSDICSTAPSHVKKLIRGFDKALCGKLSEIRINGNPKSIENCVRILDCLSTKVLPRVVKLPCLEETLLQFAVSIWNQIETCTDFYCPHDKKKLIDAAMTVMRQVLALSSVENQNTIIELAYSVVSSSTLPLMKTLPSKPVALEALRQSDMSNRDELILSLFGSVIVAACPETYIPNVRSVIHLFLVSLLRGHLPSAQALGSMVNKMGSGFGGSKISSTCSLEDAYDIIFHTNLSSDEVTLTDLCLGVNGDSNVQSHAINGLAWIGKGLLMRGDKRINDVTRTLLECLKATNSSSTMKYAAEAFHIIMSDSEICLNRTFHSIIRPLYKQRFFSTTIPLLESSIFKSSSTVSRNMLYLAFTHVVSNVPTMVILDNAKKLCPVTLEGLSVLSHDSLGKDAVFSLLLVLSAILTDKKGEESAVDNAHIIINCLVNLTSYPHAMNVRETAIQCLVAMVDLPHRRIYPFRIQVLQAIAKALDDPKRRVRGEAVKCRHAWGSIASRSIRL